MFAYIFPGQGSQSIGMGAELFDQFPDILNTADDILGYSLKTLCLNDPHNQLNQTQFTQPALYTVNALTYFHKIARVGSQIDYVAGHSLGEYNALLAAEVFDFATGLQLVKKRAELMSQATKGAMSAIIGLTAEIIEEILNKNQLTAISIANYNSHTQIVISGSSAEMEKARTLCEEAKAKMVIPLKVSGAFHSSLMKPAQEEFTQFLNGFSFSLPTRPVIANVTAKAYQPNEMQKTLANQISNPVRWTETIHYLLSQNVTQFEEIGPGNVLKGLVQRIQSGQ